MTPQDVWRLLDAKTHFSQLCDQVNSTGQALVVERRGKALVMISPLPSSPRREDDDILVAWERWTNEHPEEQEEDFPNLSSLRINKEIPPLG